MRLQPNDIFASRYRLIRKIGIGGFSEVWLAADEMVDDLECAIKIYAPDRGLDEGGLRQFRKEYMVTANLLHPGLLKASHFDIHEGSPYLIMPFCNKGSLAGIIQDRGTLTEREIAKVIYEVADALAYLHDKGIIHQDIKPDNVLIDDDGNFLITDFGISSRMRSTLRKSTTTGKALTVAYAPPERFAGAALSDQFGDVFSLGVMIFELATGDVPWMGAGGSMVKPDAAPLTLPSTYSSRLNQWMQQCLQYAPQTRPTAANLKEAASHFLEQGAWPVVTAGGRERVTEPMQVRSERETQAYPAEARPVQNQPRATHTRPSGNKPTKWIVGAVLIIVIAGAFWWATINATTQEQAQLPQADSLAVTETTEVDLETFLRRGDDNYMAEKYAEALTDFKSARELEPDNVAVQQRIDRTNKKLKEHLRTTAQNKQPTPPNSNSQTAAASSATGKEAFEQGMRDYDKGSYTTAKSYFEKSAAQDYADAYTMLGFIYYYGEGLERVDYSKAQNYFKEGMDKGDAKANAGFASLYYNGYAVAKNTDLADQYAEKSLPAIKQRSDDGSLFWMTRLGYMYYAGTGVAKNDAEAVKLFRKAAELGYPKAQTNLAAMYDGGEGVIEDDAEAVRWYRKAADQGYAKAQAGLAFMYYFGRGVAENNEKAVSWYRKAAGQGYAPAQSMLGYLYRDGVGIERSYAKAMHWYRKAADQGHAGAQFSLGMMYYNGEGVEKDMLTAEMWLEKAAYRGHETAIANLAKFF